MKPIAKVYTALLFLFLFAPILIMLVFSFNSGNSLSVLDGFSLYWYKELFHDEDTLGALRNTLILALVATLLGCIIGFVCGILNTIPCAKTDPPVKRFFIKLIRVIVRIYVEVFRGTPMMLQAVFIYYGLPYFTGNAVQWPSVWMAAILVVSINTGAYMAESVRGGIISIDPGQTEGAKAIGMTHVQTMTSVILPQALRNIMPQIGNNLIINIKDSCVLSVIGVAELLYKTKSAAGALYMNFETYTITMIVYFIMTFTCSRILRWLENRMDGSDNYDLATTDTLAHTSGMYRYEEKKKEED